MNQKEQISSPLFPENSQEIRDQLVSTNMRLETRLSSMTAEEKSRYDIQRENITQSTTTEHAHICTTCTNDRQSLLSEMEHSETEKREKTIQKFIDTYTSKADIIFFSTRPPFMQTDTRVIEKFAQFHAKNPDDERFHFSQLPDTWYNEHMNTSQGIEKLLKCAKNTDQLSYLVTRICSYTDIPQSRKEEACTRFISSDSSAEQRKIISTLLSIVHNNVVVTAENYDQLLHSLEDSSLSQEKIQGIRRSVALYSVQNGKDITEFYPQQPGKMLRDYSSSIAQQDVTNFPSEEPPEETAPKNPQQTLQKAGFDFNVSGNEEDKEGFKVKAKNGNILLAESLDGKKLALSGLGYRLEFDNNSIDMPYILSNNRTLSGMDRSCFGHFGDCTKDMIDITNEYRLLHNLPPIIINTTTKTHNILSPLDAQIMKDTFQEIGIVSWDADILSSTPAMSATIFQHRMQEIEKNGHLFFTNGRFLSDEFRRSLHRIHHSEYTTV